MKPGALSYSLLAGLVGIFLVVSLFIFTGISLAQFGKIIVQIKPWPFAGIVVCSFLYVIFGAMKWHLIAGVQAPRKFFYTHYTALAMLIGQFLPPPVAIAVNRAAVMKLKQGVALKNGLLNALYDMGFDFLIAMLLVPATLLQLFYRFNFKIWLGLSVLILLSASLLFAYAPKIIPAIWPLNSGLAEIKKSDLLSSRIIGFMMTLSAMRFVVVVCRLMLGAAALSLAIPFAVIAYTTPPATMPSLFALTPANLGIAEWSWAYLPTLWDVPTAVGVLYAVGFRVLVFIAQLIVSALCWLLYVVGNRR